MSFLLFLSLSIFGIAFMLKSTLLNPDFITAQVDKIDASVLARELTEEQTGETTSEETVIIQEAVFRVIDEQEPWLKEQVNTAIRAGYSYLLGKSDRLEIAISLEALKESFRDNLWETLMEQPMPVLLGLAEDTLKINLEQHLQEFITQIPEKYLPPELADLPDDQLRQYLDQYYDEFIAQMPEVYLTPEIVDLLEEYLKPYFDEYYEEFVGQIPDEYSFDEGSIPAEVMEQIILARQYIGYFQTGYYVLIVFMVLLVAGIILINRNVKDTTRTLGIDLLIYGVLEFAAVYLARNYDPMGLLPGNTIPPSLQTWLAGFTSDLLAPLQWFSFGILIVGAALLVVSFVYKPRVTEE